MKKFALYLPQFHRIPENDKWWGEGFTEWTNVKKAVPLYKNHIQPKIPLNFNYYNLDNVETLEWQADIAKKYCIDGFVFYHYYFCGKKLLYKPAEMLLENKNINLKFFFCWANHSWYRSWEGSKELLINQSYGDKKDWEKHFQYLLPFFKDDRYEKKDNRPIIMLFKSDFPQKIEMMDYFNELCQKNGFNGIYVIETYEDYNKKHIEKFKNQSYQRNIFLREPASSTKDFLENNLWYRIYNKIKKVNSRILNSQYLTKYSGNELFKRMIINNFPDSNIYRGLFFEWDNTPRHKQRGYVITPVDKDLFMKYMDSIKESEYIFINAWNEWCEGMMLEPTEQNGYKFLEWIKEWSNNENRINGI